MTYLRTGLSLTATLALTVSYLPPAFAQGGPGATGTLSLTQGLEFTDDFDLNSSTSGMTTISRTGLTFGVQSVTRAETLDFRIGTQLVGEFGGGANDEFEIENTNASLTYNRQGANSALTFSASFTEYDLDQSVVTLGPSFGIGFGSSTLIIDDGAAAITDIALTYQIGTRSPFGLDLTARYFDEDFSNTVDPGLIDNQLVALDALARFRIDPSRSLRALAGISRESEVGRVNDIRDSYLGLGLGGSTRGGLTYAADLLFDRTESGGVSDDGLGATLSVQQQRRTGTVGFDFGSRFQSDGRRTEAVVSRRVDLPDGRLALALGIVDQEGDSSLRPKGALTYQKDTTRGATLSASLTQDPSIDSGNIYGNTSISVGYTQSIDASSGWAADLNYTAVNEFNGTQDDKRAVARLTYTRALTQEWQMDTGFEHTRESNDSGPTESSNSVFVNIRRDVTFGF